MSEKRFKLSKYVTPSSVSYFCDENGRMLNKEVVKVLNELNNENKKLRQERERWIEKTDKLEQYIDSLFWGNTHICKHLDVEMVKFWCDKEQKYHLPQCKYKDCFKKENLVKTADEVLRSVE